ncbi:hypothetical protein Ade02nite_95940 [Paractinoplanes deccanensis]|uniref:Uncharacterized protein n=1 Tax=Paractinoplanes deccanensis TaxID=113561 RepID=A0ABQ3YLS1_9ACTN|nr:hypothetical protein [Actinoplanes deccanensis]GID80953.1 hypothetical protein Ade02nite_95940 [Actinoplanes deccanensis]
MSLPATSSFSHHNDPTCGFTETGPLKLALQLGTAVAQQADPEPRPPEFRQDAERVMLRLAEAGMTAPVMPERDGELGG